MTAGVGEVLRAQRATTLSQLGALEEQEWDEPCLPGWRVRDVVAHLVSVDEAALTGRLVPLLGGGRGREPIERWNEQAVLRWADHRPEELLAALERWGDRLARIAARVPRAVERLPAPLLYGRMPLRSLAGIRILDEWVHTVDISRVTSPVAGVAPGVPGMLGEVSLQRLPGSVLPKARPTVGVLRLVVGVGDVGDDPGGPTLTWGVDFARKHYGPRVPGATSGPEQATVRLHATALALLVEARADWRDPDLEVAIEGDEDLAAALLDVLGVGSENEVPR